MSPLPHPLIDRFLDALWLEKGLSDNTRAAYGSDLALFNGWLDERGVKLEDVSIDIVGMLDVRGINGQERIKTAFPEIRLTVTCTAHTTPEAMATVREELAWRCPASVVLRSQGAEFNETWNVTYR